MNLFIWKASLNIFNSLTPPKTPDEYTEKAVKSKKNKVYLFLSLTGVDILENKTKVSDITRKNDNSHLGFTWIDLSLSTVFAVHLPPADHLLLCRPPLFSQSLWLCGPTSCSKHLPLLPVPKQEVCECVSHFHVKFLITRKCQPANM